jgi:hypothetical protein
MTQRDVREQSAMAHLKPMVNWRKQDLGHLRAYIAEVR